MTGPDRTDQQGRAAVGRVVGAFGLRGEVKVVASDPADVRPGLAVHAVLSDGSEQALDVRSVRSHKHRLLVTFDGVADADVAGALQGALLFARLADLAPLPPDTYRDQELVGMQVTDAHLGPLGVVTGVLHYPHADMLVVGERGLLVPMLAAYEMTVDRASGTIKTSLPEGFDEL